MWWKKWLKSLIFFDFFPAIEFFSDNIIRGPVRGWAGYLKKIYTFPYGNIVCIQLTTMKMSDFVFWYLNRIVWQKLGLESIWFQTRLSWKLLNLSIWNLNMLYPHIITKYPPPIAFKKSANQGGPNGLSSGH